VWREVDTFYALQQISGSWHTRICKSTHALYTKRALTHLEASCCLVTCHQRLHAVFGNGKQRRSGANKASAVIGHRDAANAPAKRGEVFFF